MKKILLTMAILSSFLTTGCVNNSAIQKLNQSANAYLQNSQPEKAVCRLEASLELDPNIYETRYNLGIAYIDTKNYTPAIEQLTAALDLKNDSANAYYSLGVAHEGLAFSILDKENMTTLEDDGKGEIIEKKEELTNEEIQNAIPELKSAMDAYKTYLQKSPDASDKEEVEKQIISIEETIAKYAPEAQ